MTVSHQRYVAHFDMLGMSRLSLDTPEVAWSTICKLSKAKEESLSKVIELTSSKTIIRDRIQSITFSDTIIIYSKSDAIEDLYAITALCTQLFGNALKYCVPLRGGIAHGLFFTNLEHSLYAGPALVNAYTIGECAQWLGIVVDDVVAERCREIPLQREGKDIVINWQLPLKCGHLSPVKVINWPLSMREGFTTRPPYTVEQFYEAFVPLFGSYSKLGESEKKKHQNTVDFINHCLS